MRTFSVGAYRLRVHPAAPLALLLTAVRGGAPLAAAMTLSLAFHELCHAVMATALRVKVLEIELMPFGGAVRLEDAWRLRPGQLALVALAGPLGSGLLLFLSVFCLPSLEFALANALLLTLNLLPALPLDGGRVLTGLLSVKWGAGRAARAGVWAGRALAFALLALAVYGCFAYGRLNPSLPLCAAFLIAAGPRERSAAAGGALLSLIDRRSELLEEGALPMKWLAADAETTVRRTLLRLKPRSLSRVAVYDDAMRLLGIIEEARLLDAALTDAEQPLRALISPDSGKTAGHF